MGFNAYRSDWRLTSLTRRHLHLNHDGKEKIKQRGGGVGQFEQLRDHNKHQTKLQYRFNALCCVFFLSFPPTGATKNVFLASAVLIIQRKTRLSERNRTQSIWLIARPSLDLSVHNSEVVR